MKIFSKYKDYYDGIQYSLGESDPNTRYLRKQILVNQDNDYYFNVRELKNIMITNSYGSKENKKQKLYPFVIGLNGKLIEGYIVTEFLSRDYIEDFLLTGKGGYDIKVFLENKYTHKEVEKNEWIKDYDLNSLEYIFDQFQVPSFLVILDTLILNPRLKELKIPTLYDPLTIFNNIESYINERLSNHEEIKQLDDKSKIINHGFDNKTSFRNM